MANISLEGSITVFHDKDGGKDQATIDCPEYLQRREEAEARRRQAERNHRRATHPSGTCAAHACCSYANSPETTKSMTSTKWALAMLCAVIVLVFAYSFWIGVQKPPELGGPAPMSR